MFIQGLKSMMFRIIMGERLIKTSPTYLFINFLKYLYKRPAKPQKNIRFEIYLNILLKTYAHKTQC